MKNNVDFTMCNKCTCLARKSCARSIGSIPYHDLPRGQAVFADDPEANEQGSCEHFKPNDELIGAVLAPKPNPGRMKHFHMQHRMDTIDMAKQVEFFERHRITIRKPKRIENPVPGYTVEADYAGVHHVVMASSELVAMAHLSTELAEAITVTTLGG